MQAPKVLLGALLAQIEEEAGDTNPLLAYFEDGGWMMYVILVVSLIGLVVFLERGFQLYLLRFLNARSFVQALVKKIEQRQFRQALDLCEKSSKHPLIAAAKAGILRANRREKEVERAMENEMLSALPDLQRRVALMGLLANIATLLGLLGTIFGLIAAFTSVSAASAVERQSALAGGISQAMYTTAFGISVAVPLLVFHHLLSKRQERILVEVESGATAILVALTGATRDSQNKQG